MKRKSSYEVRARRFIEQFYSYIADCHMIGDFFEAVNAFNHAYHRKVVCSYGSTRVVFITSDYVIKMDLPCMDEDDTGFGNCASELQFYNYAEECGFEHLFAKIEQYTYNNMTFYIMPRIYGVGHMRGHAENYLSGDEFEFVSEHCSDLHDENFGMKNKHVVIIDYACNSIGCDWD